MRGSNLGLAGSMQLPNKLRSMVEREKHRQLKHLYSNKTETLSLTPHETLGKPPLPPPQRLRQPLKGSRAEAQHPLPLRLQRPTTGAWGVYEKVMPKGRPGAHRTNGNGGWLLAWLTEWG